MAAAMRCVASVVLASCWLGAVLSFNLEPRIPIVKKGSQHSHFGYSVAQHKSFGGNPKGITKKSWILVGAPKDHNLQPGTNRSGALYKCPLTTLTTDCTQVPTDGFRSPEKRIYIFDRPDESLFEPGEDEIKDGQWLGVTLKSQGPGGKVLVCAHRYIHKGLDFQWGFGLCYILSDDLTVSESLEPCRGKPVDSGAQQYGFCQAGTSGLLLEDEAVLGVPGPFTWRGTVHTSNISDNFLLKDKTQYFGPVTEADSPVNKYSYLGYSVTAGRFFGNYISYVGGAPRSKETGQVVFLTREQIGNSLLRKDLILSGEMFASSFGYEVLAIDINGDERDDLVVGAPFYYSRKSSGAIYVYMNKEGGFKENHPFTRIEGAPGESRFGSSMTSLGDLNHDGFLDVAVGAPYEGRGAIYIFLGNKDGLSTEAAQVIRAEDVPGTPYNAFGYALSGGMDLDNNGYPDLLTSSFCSDRVLLLRARPIIDIETKVSSKGQLDNIDPTKKGCREDIRSNETCFSFDACFKMDNDAGTETDLRLHYTIEERLYQDRPLARVRFADSAPNQPTEVHRNISLWPDDMGIFQCFREVVYLLEGSHDILRPLRFKMTYEIIQKEPRQVAEGDPLPDINEYPILNQREALREFEGTFAKECGDDDICMSDLHLTGELDLEPDPTGKHYLLKLGVDNTVPLLVEVSNSREPAYETTLYVTHDEALIFVPDEPDTGTDQCIQLSPGMIKCALDNPLVNTTGLLRLSFQRSGKVFDSKYIYFSVFVNSSSTEVTHQEPLHFEVEVIKKAEVSIKGDASPEQVFYGGEIVGESAIKHLDEIGTEVIHKYVVHNDGPWRLDELYVDVLWPHQVENGKEKGKWLLYMTEHPTVHGIGECEIDPSLINPLNLRRSKIYPDSFTGHEVDIEVESTDSLKPPTEAPTSIGGSEIKTSTSVKNTTIKKTTIKTSYRKESSETSGGSTSTSSSSRTHSSSSHSGFGSYDDNVEGSGYDGHSSRVYGRTHSRVSRKVYSSSDRTRFDENDLGSETTKEDKDEDGRIISQYEKTHHSSGKSPDGTSTFKETRHESKKVTVSENTYPDNVPSSRWGQGGGYRRTYTENRSSVRTSDGEPRETHTRWETHETYPAGQDSENQWGESGSSDIHGRGEEIRREHKTYAGESSTRRTHSDQLEDNYRRTHEGGAETRTFGHGDSYFGGGDRTRTRDQDGRDDRDRFVWTDQRERTPYDRRTENRNREGSYYEERTHKTDNVNTEGRVGSGPHSESDGDGYERRVASSSQWSRTRYEDRSSSSRGFKDDRLSGTHDSRGSDRGFDDRYSSSHRSSGGGYDDRYSSSHRGSEGSYDDRYSSSRRGSEGGYDDRYSSSHRGSDGGYDDRYSSGQDSRSHQDRYDDRIYQEGEHTRTYSSNYDQTRGRDENRGLHSEGITRRREDYEWQQGEHRRPEQDESGRDETYRGNYDDSGRHRSRSESHSSTWHSHSSSRHRGRGGSHHHEGLDDNYERHHAGASSERHFAHLESDGPLANGTYTRVEVDPKTGKTTTYSRKVVYNKWQTDPDHRWASEDSTGFPGEEQELYSNQRSARTKREKELIIKPQAVTDKKTGKTMQVVHLHCDGEQATAKCFPFRCYIRNLAKGTSATIHIKSRLWNSTLVEDYPRVSSVSIKSKASLILPEDIRYDQNTEDDEDSAETQAYPDLLDQLPPEEVPLWVILVSIFAGLLLLVIIVLILWKLGFFKRRRPDPTLTGNLDKDANGY